MNYETASYLCHHGVKGMKWGVRKKSDRVKTSRSDRKRNKIQSQYDKELSRFKRKAEVYKDAPEANKKYWQKISKMSTRDYIKEAYGFDIDNKKSRKEFETVLSEFDVKHPEKMHQQDIEYARMDYESIAKRANRARKVYEEYKNVKVDDLKSSRDAKRKAKKISKKYEPKY